MRQHNLSLVLRLVHGAGALSRSDLATGTGLNRSTVKVLLQELAEVGLLEEAAPTGSGGTGRPSISVRPLSERTYVLALDIGVEHLTAMLVGLGGRVLARRDLNQSAADFGVDRTLARLTRLVTALRRDATPGSVCIGIGVGVCGMVSAEEGLVRFAPNLGWVDVPLRDLLAERLRTDLPIELGNDGDLGARAEVLRGAAVGCRDVVYLSGEVGIGGGLVLDGRPLRGAGGFAGEIGHMTVDHRGRLCRCGNRGCWETEIGEEAVLLATGAPPGSTFADVLQAHADGQEWPRAGLDRVGRMLGVGVVTLVNIFNPELVLFGGVTRHLYLATEPIVRDALSAALAAPRRQVRLAVAGLGDDSIALGAAELAFEPLLDDPLGEALGRPGGVRALA